MAKTDNLTDFLTDVANAIREKKGTTGTINPQDFSSEIASIESGGGVVTSASVSDVNFYDYDGTILYSYTKEQFLALSAMPKLPTREGLICQGWNYTLSESKSYVTDYGKLDIGAMYITDDGDTRLYIRIATEGRMTVPLYWSQTVSSGVGIDWGDGSAIQSFTGTGNKNTTHTYANPGDYVIRLKVTSNCTLKLGNGSYSVMGITSTNNIAYCNMIYKIELGNNITEITDYSISYLRSLREISIPNNILSLKTRSMQGCNALTHLNLGHNVTVNNFAFLACISLSSISMGAGCKLYLSETFASCHALRRIIIPNVQGSSEKCFYNCYSLIEVKTPSNFSTIPSNTFSGCYGAAIYDFTNHTSVPTLASTNAFTNIPSDCVIKVPSSLLSAWKSATNWSTYASKIVAG